MKKDALETLGTIITEDEVRDAVHVACLPAQALKSLKPSQRVGYKDGVASTDYDHIGIVDPFLKHSVKKGEHFWIMLFPRTITGLRHLWSHPALPDHNYNGNEFQPEPSKTDAESYLRYTADYIGIGFNELLSGADDFTYCGEIPCTRGYEPDHRSLPDVDKFWESWKVYTGREIPEDTEIYWSCSC